MPVIVTDEKSGMTVALISSVIAQGVDTTLGAWPVGTDSSPMVQTMFLFHSWQMSKNCLNFCFPNEVDLWTWQKCCAQKHVTCQNNPCLESENVMQLVERSITKIVCKSFDFDPSSVAKHCALQMAPLHAIFWINFFFSAVVLAILL